MDDCPCFFRVYGGGYPWMIVPAFRVYGGGYPRNSSKLGKCFYLCSTFLGFEGDTNG